MREIKFRAWDSYKEEMYNWNQIVIFDIKGHLTLSNLLNGFIRHIKPIQFTGLNDKNGKEIYEGDIIKVLNNIDRVGEVAWFQEGMCYIIHDPDKMNERLSAYPKKWFEIIGNIYENPGLINLSKMKIQIPKQLAEKYNIVIDGSMMFVHNPDGVNTSCIGMPIDDYFEIENCTETWDIRCEKAVLTLWKKNHSTHLTIFS